MDSRDRIDMLKSDMSGWLVDGIFVRAVAVAIAICLLATIVLGFMWSGEPELKDVREITQSYSSQENRAVVPGSYTATTLIYVAETLLDKPGGFLSNDVMPPGIILDNMPNWEFGVLVQVRDLARPHPQDNAVQNQPPQGAR